MRRHTTKAGAVNVSNIHGVFLLIYYQNNDKMAKGIKKGKQKWSN